MKKLCTDVDLIKLEIYRSQLDDYKINTVINNRHQSALMGLLPFTEVWPELWVTNDSDYEKAIKIIGECKLR